MTNKLLSAEQSAEIDALLARHSETCDIHTLREYMNAAYALRAQLTAAEHRASVAVGALENIRERSKMWTSPKCLSADTKILERASYNVLIYDTVGEIADDALATLTKESQP